MDLTIAICAYNGAERLQATFRALAAQQVDPSVRWELLYVDNASTDNSIETAQRLGIEFSLPIRIIPEPRKGKINAIRTAATEAQAPILSYLDDDNVVQPDWITACLAFFRDHPRAGIIGPRIDPIFEDPSSRPPDFDEHYANALAVRDFGDQPMQLLPPQHDGPPGAGMTGRTNLFRAVLLRVHGRLSGPKESRLSRGEDSEIDLIAHRLGWEIWYAPSLRMGHVLPPRRLRPDYLNRLIAEGSQSSAWLDYLRGNEPQRGRAFYFWKWASWRTQSLKMAALARIRRNTPQAAKLRFWRDMFANRADGYLELAISYPFKDFELSLASAAATARPRDLVEAVTRSTIADAVVN